jgi:hypothetical protein
MTVVIGRNRGPKTPEETAAALRKVSLAFRVIAAVLLMVNACFIFFFMQKVLALGIIPVVFLLVSLALSVYADRLQKP